jgi:hypothetical protein
MLSKILPVTILLSLTSSVGLAKWENVAGEWEQYRLNESQMKWFGSVHSKNKVPCCSIADGHPTDSVELSDGFYVPDPLDTTGGSPWIKVPPEALTIPPNNPVGTAVVWYTVRAKGEVSIRCFVPESKV